MGRLLLLTGLVALSVYLVKKIYLDDKTEKHSEKQEPALMKKCSHCELHLPKEQGLTDSEGRFFCSEEHKQAFRQ